MQHDTMHHANWFKDAFGDLYPILYAHRSVAQAEQEARFAAAQLQLKRSDFLLDVCCGGGRHLMHLMNCAGATFGLDYSRYLLDEARATLPASRLVRADMRAIPFVNAFDAVTSFFTSFGYFLEDAENARVLTEIARSLKTGGRFFIDHVNAQHIEEKLAPRTVRWLESHEIREERWIDRNSRRLNKKAAIFQQGVCIREHRESVRLYAPQEFESLLRTAGLATVSFFGGFHGEPLAREHARMIAVGAKV